MKRLMITTLLLFNATFLQAQISRQIEHWEVLPTESNRRETIVSKLGSVKAYLERGLVPLCRRRMGWGHLGL